MYSILYNLISNGIKYRRPDVPPVISLRSAIDGDSMIIIVKDNGIGLYLAKHKDDLFGLYKRFHNHVEGKGMGLYMTKKQIEALSGKISVQSNLIDGTEFTITLPLG